VTTLLGKFIDVVKTTSWDNVFLKNLESQYFGDSLEKEPYKKSELVYICISTTNRAIGQVPIQLLRPTGKVRRMAEDQRMGYFLSMKRLCTGVSNYADFVKTEKLLKDGVLEPVGEDDPYNVLLSKPNSYMSGQHFKESLVGNIMLDGNVWVIPLPLTFKVTPDFLYIARAGTMSPVRNETTGQLEYWSYNPRQDVGAGSKGSKVLPNELMHIKLWNPYDVIIGLSPLAPANIAMKSDFKAAAYNEKFFDEGAVPGGLLTTTQRLGDKQFLRTRDQFEERHQSFNKAHRVALLEQGLKWEQTGLSQSDMQYSELRNLSAERIMQILGMKKTIISKTESLNYAIAKEERKAWWQDTCLPIMKLISSTFNYGLLANVPYIARWDISTVEALHEDYEEKEKTGASIWQMGFTANELNDRLQFGFDPKPWREYAYAPANLLQIEPSGGNGNNGNGNNGQESILSDVVKLVELLVSNKSIIDVPLIDKSSRGNTQVWRELMEEVNPIERRFQSKVTKTLSYMRRKVLSHLYDKDKKGIDEVMFLSFEEEAEMLAKGVEPLYTEAVRTGLKTLNANWETFDSEAVAFIQNKKINITGLTSTVSRQVRGTLTEGLSEGASIDKIASKLREQFNIASGRAKIIARTEVSGALNFGRSTALQTSGYPSKQWVTARDALVRQSHSMMEGQIIAAHLAWIVNGSSLMYPGDYSGAAAEIINCRCIEVPSEEKTSEAIIPYEDVENSSMVVGSGVSRNRVRSILKECY